MTQESMAFMIRYTSGLVCVSLENERADELDQRGERGNHERFKRGAEPRAHLLDARDRGGKSFCMAVVSTH